MPWSESEKGRGKGSLNDWACSTLEAVGLDFASGRRGREEEFARWNRMEVGFARGMRVRSVRESIVDGGKRWRAGGNLGRGKMLMTTP